MPGAIRRLLEAIVAGLLVAGAAPLAAQPLPVPRSYPPTGFERAAIDPPADILARDTAAADAAEARCNDGESAGCTALGKAYETGAGRPQNRPVAELLYRDACNAAEAEACLRLGHLLRFADSRPNWPISAEFFARACLLGSAEGCAAEADDREYGVFGVSDPDAAMALRRATCAGGRGDGAVCTDLAQRLLENPADRAEARALLDTACSAGHAPACAAAASHWREAAGGADVRVRGFERRGCEAGDDWACHALGTALLRGEWDDGTADDPRLAAAVFFERACALRSYRCPLAEAVRNAPARAACTDAAAPGCLAFARFSADPDGPLHDAARAAALFARFCDAAATPEAAGAICAEAADVALQGAAEGVAVDPALLDRQLARACAAGERPSCLALAVALEAGDVLPADRPRALALHDELCAGGEETACKRLAAAAREDPSAPLPVAGADTPPPEYTEEELAAMMQAHMERQRRAQEERDARACTSSVVEFRGVLHHDTICQRVVAIINGFEAKTGDAPWQALLWRPARLNDKNLSDAQRVLCGGAVIRPGWMLTAAHCLVDEGGVPVLTGGHRIRTGVTNPLADEGFSYPILKVIPHPEFKRRNFLFDIALIQYDTRAGEKRGKVGAVGQIPLDTQPIAARPIQARMPVYTFGWGRTALEGGAPPDVLRGARLELRNLDDCTRITGFRDARRHAVLCAAGPRGEQACFGDSGGPLIVYSEARTDPRVLGVVSAGVKCGTMGVPSRFTRIAHPRVWSWLRSILPGLGIR